MALRSYLINSLYLIKESTQWQPEPLFSLVRHRLYDFVVISPLTLGLCLIKIWNSVVIQLIAALPVSNRLMWNYSPTNICHSKANKQRKEFNTNVEREMDHIEMRDQLYNWAIVMQILNHQFDSLFAECFFFFILLESFFIFCSERSPDGGHKCRQSPTENSIEFVRKTTLKHCHRYDIMQIQSFDPHPHEHSRTCIFQ